MTNSVRFDVQRSSDQTRVLVEGELTEAADLSAVLELTPPSLILDLAGVRKINSYGVRQWVNFIRKLQERGQPTVLDRCSVPVVTQLNSIANFSGGAKIQSFYAPYACDACGTTDQKLFTVQEASAQALEAPISCPQCQEPMSFDDLADAYLLFLR